MYLSLIHEWVINPGHAEPGYILTSLEANQSGSALFVI